MGRVRAASRRSRGAYAGRGAASRRARSRPASRSRSTPFANITVSVVEITRSSRSRGSRWSRARRRPARSIARARARASPTTRAGSRSPTCRPGASTSAVAAMIAGEKPGTTLQSDPHDHERRRWCRWHGRSSDPLGSGGRASRIRLASTATSGFDELFGPGITPDQRRVKVSWIDPQGPVAHIDIRLAISPVLSMAWAWRRDNYGFTNPMLIAPIGTTGRDRVERGVTVSPRSARCQDHGDG